MARGARNRPTREMIMQLVSKLYAENGFTATETKEIARQLGISTGNLNFHYPTKEHLLAEFVKELCAFQRHLIEELQQEDRFSLLALCIEFAAMAAAAEEDPAIRDIYVSAYTYPMSLAVIRAHDVQKTQEIFAEFCPDWSDEQFAVMENFFSGVEYGMFSSLGSANGSLERRIVGGLNAIMELYHVPEDLRRQMIERVISMDYRSLGKRMLSDFREYIAIRGNQAVEEAVQNMMKKKEAADAAFPV